jgi:hypothetical protein
MKIYFWHLTERTVHRKLKEKKGENFVEGQDHTQVKQQIRPPKPLKAWTQGQKLKRRVPLVLQRFMTLRDI